LSVCDTQRQTERDRETTCAACEAAVVYTSQCRQSTADAAVNVDSETLSPPHSPTQSVCDRQTDRQTERWPVLHVKQLWCTQVGVVSRLLMLQ